MIIITLHPVTTLEGETGQCVQALLAVMDQYPATYIITLPNADPGNALIRMEFTSWVEKHPNSRAVEALGEQAYFSLMREADLMAGNSSSGLIEAGAFLLPVIDIGNRQQGRLRGLNVIHSEPDAHLLLEVFRKGVSQEFRASLIGTTSPYGDGKSGQRILEVLKSGVLPKSTLKIFHQIDNSC